MTELDPGFQGSNPASELIVELYAADLSEISSTVQFAFIIIHQNA
ncbi:MAG TPA: hypothetical protein PLY09_00455 [Methanothrix sp.]|nr:hypothetical protein [Methanothrix sp.]